MNPFTHLGVHTHHYNQIWESHTMSKPFEWFCSTNCWIVEGFPWKGKLILFVLLCSSLSSDFQNKKLYNLKAENRKGNWLCLFLTFFYFLTFKAFTIFYLELATLCSEFKVKVRIWWFHTKSDFAKSFLINESVFGNSESRINIPNIFIKRLSLIQKSNIQGPSNFLLFWWWLL